jgi:hypothetical protein
MNFEKDLAVKVLNENWKNRPNQINSSMIIDLTKQGILKEFPEIQIDKEKYSIQQIYEKIGYKSGLVTTEETIYPGKEIKNETEFAKNWLTIQYSTMIELLKNFHTENNQ